MVTNLLPLIGSAVFANLGASCGGLLYGSATIRLSFQYMEAKKQVANIKMLYEINKRAPLSSSAAFISQQHSKSTITYMFSQILFQQKLPHGQFKMEVSKDLHVFSRIWLRYMDNVSAIFDTRKSNDDDFVQSFNQILKIRNNFHFQISQ